ncbi:hypothetical protein EUX98_g5140 [Antrodiella citrinella]|uniref:Enoyl reductase (ER) domain-containing protein n=1 Tax=Antrodiella citrinella TaxID=2447956 RepID=A0A4S4N041_9APHY|nr:hypothetical protein EUX98_g5140 [Antrodiella citrinella]
MSIVTNGRLLYAAHPTTFQLPGVHTKYVEVKIDLETVALDGGVLIRTLALSSDPVVRIRMRDPKIDHFFPALILGRPIDNWGVGVVVRSEKPGFQPGDFVYGFISFENYSVYPGPPEAQHQFQFLQKIAKHPSIPASVYVHDLGMTGETAYAGWHAYAKEKAKTSKTFFVNSAAGPVGTFLIEYVRHIHPHIKIIASAGSAEKLEILKEAGADVVFNYKTTNTGKVLAEHGPVDIFWDHVGGTVLDDTLLNMAQFGIIIRVGTVTGYNEEDTGIKNIKHVVFKSLTMHGLVIGIGEAMQTAAVPFLEEATKLVLDGTIKTREWRFEGLQQAGQALADVHFGQQIGKPIIIVAED